MRFRHRSCRFATITPQPRHFLPLDRRPVRHSDFFTRGVRSSSRTAGHQEYRVSSCTPKNDIMNGY